MAAFRDRIGRLLYPEDAVCVACGALRVDDTQRHICRACAERLTLVEPPFCPRCGASGWAMVCPNCLMLPPDDMDGRVSAYRYEGTARLLIQALKYTNVAQAAQALAMGMEAVLPPGRYDGLAPVPLYRVREKQRGFNQARALCEALSRHIGIPVMDCLQRVRATQTQTRLSREGRRDNVRGAFEPCAAVEGRALILVDDVFTTGATALACAETLKRAGAASVLLLTAARAREGADG